MKRSLGSSDSLGALMSICPSSTDEQSNNQIYTREFQTMLEGLDEDGCCLEESAGGHHLPEKKRRLSVEQVKALEKYFEVENKLEPERKVKVAQELGLQPRQVAVWFQNRRARWKTKQLERDYGVLKASYDSLKLNFDSLKQNNESLLKEIQELKGKLNEEKKEKNVVVKEEEMGSENEKQRGQLDNSATKYDDEETIELNFESFNGCNDGGGITIFTDLKDGSSDSDTSAILNEENNNIAVQSESPSNITHFLIPNDGKSSSPSYSTSSMNGCFQFMSSSKEAILEEGSNADKIYHPHLVKIEEHNFFSTEDSCTTFFSDDQPPTLHWYNPDEWN